MEEAMLKRRHLQVVMRKWLGCRMAELVSRKSFNFTCSSSPLKEKDTLINIHCDHYRTYAVLQRKPET